MGLSAWVTSLLLEGAIAQPEARNRPDPRRREEAPRSWGGWLADPRSGVLIVLGSVLLLGGGRKILKGMQARRVVGMLGDPGATAADIEEAARHGRAGLFELFRILGSAGPEAQRTAAGHALTVLWAQDQLIAEEEKALVVRGYHVSWHARRRYPRALRGPIPISVSYGLPFLREGGAGISPANLEWSHRILGAERVALETFSPWIPGPGRAEFAINPGDFASNGPHRIELRARVRTSGLTSAWEYALPHVPFSFEFDPALRPEALLALEDAARGEVISRAVRLEPDGPDDPGSSRFLDLGDGLALRDPPRLAVATPLPCDLAHTLWLEFEGLPGRFAAGEVLLSGQGTGRDEPAGGRSFPIGPIAPIPPGLIPRPGPLRVRAVLVADPDKGWADPDIRSIWPGEVATGWSDVRVVRL